MRKKKAEGRRQNTERKTGACRRSCFISAFCFLLSVFIWAFSAAAQTNSATPAPEPGTNAVTQKNIPAPRPPTDIFSDHGRFNLRSNVFVYDGNVRIDDSQMELTCDLLTVEAPKLPPSEKYNRATADGNVIIDFIDDKGETNHATSERAVYTYSITNFVTNAFVVLTGNPVVTNTQGAFAGDPIVWDRIKDEVTSPHLLRMTIQQNQTNAPDFFGGMSQSKTNAPKPKSKEVPR